MATTQTIHQLHINHLISVKLDETNYLLWLTQFKPLLKGYQLIGYVDGTLSPPPQTLPDSTEINPEFLKWEEHDQILLSWLLSSLSDSVLSRVVGLTTSRAVWEALEKRFASKNQAHQMLLRRTLNNLHKGNKTMQQYFSSAKQLSDALAAFGKPITDSELQQAILNGLDQAYDAIVTTLTTLVDLDMDAFFAHLLAFEMHLENQTASLQQPIANVASFKRNSDSKSSHQSNRQTSDTYQTRANTRRFSNNQKPQIPQGPCQLCGKNNHLAQDCWFRFNRQYAPPVKQPPTAYITAPSNWVTDTGATNHLTADLNNLNIHHEYDGTEQVKIGPPHEDNTAPRKE